MLFRMIREYDSSLETTEQISATPQPDVNYILKILNIESQESDGSDQETASEPGSSPAQLQTMLDPFHNTLGVEGSSFEFVPHNLPTYQTSNCRTGSQGLEPSIDMPALHDPNLSADGFPYNFSVGTCAAQLPMDPDSGYGQHSSPMDLANGTRFQLDYPLDGCFIDPGHQDELWVDAMGMLTPTMRNYMEDHNGAGQY